MINLLFLELTTLHLLRLGISYFLGHNFNLLLYERTYSVHLGKNIFLILIL